MNEDLFLEFVYEYVKEHPDIAARVTEATTLALSSALMLLRHQASDMESCAFQLLKNKKPKALEFLEEKLIKWKGKLSLRWDWYWDDKK